MEVFNIHLFEFLLIAGLALVIFGPERLPEVGRFIGKQVARFLAWQQQSPELKMINEIRSEFEGEIASLRDELVRTRKQLDVSNEMAAIRNEIRPMLDLRADVNEVKAAAQNGAAAAVEPPTPGVEPVPSVIEPVPSAVDPVPSPGPGADQAPAQTVQAAARPNRIAATEPTNLLNPPAPAPEAELPPLPRHRQDLHAPAERDPDIPAHAPLITPGQEPPQADESQRLVGQLQSLVTDMQALVAELQERGLIGSDWQPPSQARPQETISR